MSGRYDKVESLIYQALQKVEELRNLVDQIENELRNELRKLEAQIDEIEQDIAMLSARMDLLEDERNG